MATSAGRKKTVSSTAKTKSTTTPSFLCSYCGQTKKKTEFYVSSDPMVKTGVTHMCRDCARKIARNYNPRTGIYGECTRMSTQEALERLDKPFMENVWVTAVAEYNNGGIASPWEAYIRIISGPAFETMRWRDGDIYSAFRENAKKEAFDAVSSFQNIEMPVVSKETEIDEQYKKNREDVIRLIGYDPFDKEAEEDKPLLYSQLIGYLDTSGDSNDDMMRISSAISIVRAFSQSAKIDDMLSDIFKNPQKATSSVGTIKSLQDAKKNANKMITDLAAESCLSLKNNKNASKGENTWTGKIKKLKELNLREAEVNGFDIGTCRGMQQVMDLSNASILKQLRLDESEYSDMLAEQRVMITDLQKARDTYKEISRILLRENIDLKDTLKENNLLDESNLVDIEKLFSPFSEITSEDEEEVDYEEEL